MNVVSRKTADDFLEFMEVYTARYLLGDRPDAAVSKANKATKYNRHVEKFYGRDSNELFNDLMYAVEQYARWDDTRNMDYFIDKYADRGSLSLTDMITAYDTAHREVYG